MRQRGTAQACRHRCPRRKRRARRKGSDRLEEVDWRVGPLNPMSWAYAHVLSVLGMTAAVVIMVAAASARFGTVMPSQRAWAMLAGFTSIVAVVSSARFFSETCRETVNALQLATLPTPLSGVAAVGVVLQGYQVPYVYTTIDPRLSRRVLGLVLPANQRSRLELHVHNCSNVTAHDIIVQG